MKCYINSVEISRNMVEINRNKVVVKGQAEWRWCPPLEGDERGRKCYRNEVETR